MLLIKLLVAPFVGLENRLTSSFCIWPKQFIGELGMAQRELKELANVYESEYDVDNIGTFKDFLTGVLRHCYKGKLLSRVVSSGCHLDDN